MGFIIKIGCETSYSRYDLDRYFCHVELYVIYIEKVKFNNKKMFTMS